MSRAQTLVLIVALLMILTGAAAIFHAGASNSQAPVAYFTYSPDVPGPQDLIVFNASSSYSPNGWIVQYTWDFGDGNISTVTDPVVTHAFYVDGDYTVQLTVTDNNGYTGVAVAVIPVRCVVFFRVVAFGTTIPLGSGGSPLANVTVTAYCYNGSAWVKAPASNKGIEIKYDRMTQPNLANNDAQRYRNPGYTASILRASASNIGFEIHSIMTWKVFFKFELGSYVTYWPNNTTRVYTYEPNHGGVVKTHDYLSGHQAYWDPAASAYVIEAEDIAGAGVSPTEDHPILVGLVNCNPPTPAYYLTVKTSPQGITTIPGEGLYIANTNVTLTAPTYVNVSTTARYRFDYWDVDGTSRGSGVNQTTVFMNGNHTATAHYVTQYSVTFSQTGLSSEAAGTIVTVNGIPQTFTQLPYVLWADGSSSVAYSHTSTVPSSVSGKQFRFNNVTGPSSPITVSGPATVTGNYATQYLVTFGQTGLDSTAIGTVVTVNGDAKNFSILPNSTWFDSGSFFIYSYNSPVSSSTGGKRFKFNNVTGPSSPITVGGVTNVTGNYKMQYLITFNQTRLNSNTTSTVVTVNGTAKTYANLPDNEWFDSGSFVPYSYNNVVLSSVTGEQFKLVNVTGLASPISVTGPSTVTGNYKTQYLIEFQQAGAGSDFAGTVVTVDSVSFGCSSLPNSSWWDQGSSHTFAFASPLTVDSTKQYAWNSTLGLSNHQSGTLAVTTSGTVTGNYIVQNCITFSQTGVGLDFSGTVVIVDGYPYAVSALTISFNWSIGSMHSFSFQSPLIVGANAKQYVWTSTTGLSSSQSGSINVTSFGSIVGNYKTQYYLTLATNPLGVASPSGAGWYDANTYANPSTAQFVDIVPGSSRYRFNNWTTADMSEITNPSVSATTVLMDKNKTVTANYVTQYLIIFSQAGVGSDFAGTVVTVDSVSFGCSSLPNSSWWDQGSSHVFTFSSHLVVNVSKQYNWASTSGLTALQSGTLNVAGSGSVTGNYAVENKLQITFSQTGVTPDFTGTVVTIDGSNFNVTALSSSFWWDVNSVHTFAYQSPLVVNPNAKQYIWISTTGLSTLQSGNTTATTSGSIIGNYKTQYCLSLATSPPSVTTPSGAGWYDAGTNASISTTAFIDIVPGSSRYRFNGWTTADMTEIQYPNRSPTTVSMDQDKTVTADYVVQYNITFNHVGVGSDFSGTVATIDGWDYNRSALPAPFLWDSGSIHTFSFASPLNALKQYVWMFTSGGLSTSQADSITVSASGNVAGNYAVTYTLTITATTGGATNPAVGVHVYPSGSTVQVAALPNINYQFDHWELDSTNVGAGNPYPVLMDTDHTLNAVFKLVPPALSVSINPLSGMIQIGQPLTFNSVVSGGAPRYSYQWYLDGTPVAGATSSSWTWTPEHASLHFVYVKVTDSNDATAQSELATITVISTPVPVGGYSISFAGPSVPMSIIAYVAVVALSAAVLSAKKRKRK